MKTGFLKVVLVSILMTATARPLRADDGAQKIENLNAAGAVALKAASLAKIGLVCGWDATVTAVIAAIETLPIGGFAEMEVTLFTAKKWSAAIDRRVPDDNDTVGANEIVMSALMGAPLALTATGVIETVSNVGKLIFQRHPKDVNYSATVEHAHLAYILAKAHRDTYWLDKSSLCRESITDYWRIVSAAKSRRKPGADDDSSSSRKTVSDGTGGVPANGSPRPSTHPAG